MMHVLVVRLSIVVMVGLGSSQSVMAQGRTENVVLVTLDGARYQEVFGGLDRDLLQSTAGKAPLESLTSYKKFWASTPEERRQRLLPFFWGTLMKQGSVAGNQSLGSVARITNSHRFSYPGYSEILTGEAHDAEIKSNDLIQNPFRPFSSSCGASSIFRSPKSRPSPHGASFPASWSTSPARSPAMRECSDRRARIRCSDRSTTCSSRCWLPGT